MEPDRVNAVSIYPNNKMFYTGNADINFYVYSSTSSTKDENDYER